MSLKPGDKAPNFTLYSSDKEEVSLDSFQGKSNVVLLFFPQSFTGGCTKEMCSMRDDIASYQNLDAKVIAISVDSIATLNKFKSIEELNFLLLSDFNKEVSRAYDAIYEEWVFNMRGVSKRSAFVIDKQGVIRYAEVLDNPGELPNFEAVKSTLESL